jgi:hypothetical protein
MGNTTYTNSENQEILNNMGKNYAEEYRDEITEDVQELWSGNDEDFWSAYIAEVLGDKIVDSSKAEGKNYRVVDLGGGDVSL